MGGNMRLRNKKTGVIIEPDRVAIIKNTKETSTASFNRIAANYYSLAELNEEWEDYKPAEPLIKDEKIRKAVQAWAEANHVTRVKYDASWNSFRCTDFVIGFDYDFDRHDGLEDEESYTIAELCGEEEE